ncbi:MAG TPA: DMT family transporter [Parapedobacter sp.]|uniref:DMT family transporter n=1 Tax=Parapedobacter sp. TaxID=1958893 RepID=UPI002B75FF1C|nr:DMT family transporter [Parapedobacter sp.]HWK58810.1 DMT family transporter [Parapedobacter sp.]
MNPVYHKWVLLGILTLTWGSSFILIKQGLVVYTPTEVGALRLCVAGLALVFFGVRSFRHIPKKLMPWVVAGGGMGNFIPMFLFPLAQERVSSSMAGILDSLVPMFILLFGFLFFGIKSRMGQVVGAVIGFVGAAMLMGVDADGGKSDVFHSLLIILATAFYGMNGLIINRYLSGIPSFKLSAAVFTIWFGPSLIILGFTGFFSTFTGTAAQWQGLGYVTILGLVGTALAMILFYKLLQLTSALFASMVTYLIPIVAVMWGVLDGERLGWSHALGGTLILMGVYLIQRQPSRKRERPIMLPHGASEHVNDKPSQRHNPAGSRG